MIGVHKIINDPVHGFISIPPGIITKNIEHPWFQRLRDIKQLGLTNLVYPGATHSRLSHALGAMHLMRDAIAVLRSKGIIITIEEEEAAAAAILLHDIGHGPFSHALENNIIVGVSHEEISLALMRKMNDMFSGGLDLAIQIFEGTYHKKFLHQLVSGQLDVDRLDYLKRDSFFSGVAEGMIGLERIIKMLTVHDNLLAIEHKGIYSVEKFLISRRLMYWQVYLHKTVLAAERLLINIFKRARFLTGKGEELAGSPSIRFFLLREFSADFLESDEVLGMFTALDDTDIMAAIKQWQNSNDFTLSLLCKMLIIRKLPKLRLYNEPIADTPYYIRECERIKGLLAADDILDYFIESGEVTNKGYDLYKDEIRVVMEGGRVEDIYAISDMLSTRAFSQITKKHFICIANLN